MATIISTPPTKSLKALVIGGGIAGPAVSLFLERAGIKSIVYESHASSTDIGGSIILGPNGLRVLDAIGLAKKVMNAGTIIEEFTIRNLHGKRLGTLPGGSKKRYGYSSIILRRSTVHKTLIEALKEKEIVIEYSKKLITINETDSGVKVRFEDGTESEGDFVIGCDGIRSKVRDYILAQNGRALQPSYTGLVVVGGFVPGSALPEIDISKGDSITMSQGPGGFTAHSYNHTTKEWLWWCNFEATEEVAHNSIKTASDSTLRQDLLALYGKWHEPIPSLIAAQSASPSRAIIYDIPPLLTWHSSRVVLVGDSAHATSPHGGQGVSLALEDAMLLAKFLRDYSKLEEAFVEYERLRQPRVEKFVTEARSRGERKKGNGFLGNWFRDFTFALISTFMPESWSDDQYAYAIEWEKEEKEKKGKEMDVQNSL